MHGTGVLCVLTAHWVVSDTHTSRAIMFEKLSLSFVRKLGWCKDRQKSPNNKQSTQSFKDY